MSGKPREHMSINIHVIPSGMFAGGWRGMARDGRYWVSIEHYVDLAKIAERGKLDAVLRAVQQNAQKPVDMPNDKTKDQ